MTEDNALRRPIGWWLKEAEARLDAAFVGALELHGADRRDWQILTSLARADAPRGEIRDALGAFGEPGAIDATIQGLIDRGWVTEGPAGMLHLTEDGTREREVWASSVEEIRHTVADALPGDDYPTLVRLLARLVDALPPTPE